MVLATGLYQACSKLLRVGAAWVAVLEREETVEVKMVALLAEVDVLMPERLWRARQVLNKQRRGRPQIAGEKMKFEELLLSVSSFHLKERTPGLLLPLICSLINE